MSGMINGSDKFFLMFHRGNSMHFEGFKSEEDMAEQLLYQARCLTRESTEQRIEAIEQLAKRVIDRIKQDDELPENYDDEKYED